jgi:hypothetical protein
MIKIGKIILPVKTVPYGAPFTFVPFSSAENRAFVPEARPLGAKSIGGKRIPAGGPIVFPQNEAGGSGARPGAPTRE